MRKLDLRHDQKVPTLSPTYLEICLRTALFIGFAVDNLHLPVLKVAYSNHTEVVVLLLPRYLVWVRLPLLVTGTTAHGCQALA